METLFECLYKNMQTELEDIFKDIDRYRIIHVSHSDLDGYGCTIVGQLATFTSIDPNKNAYKLPKINTNYRWYNQSKLGNAIYEKLDELFIGISCEQDHKPLVVIISDIGNITIDEIVARYRGINYGNIRFFVVDHHRHNYSDIEMVTSNYRRDGSTDHNSNYVGMYSSTSGMFKIWVYQSNSNTSATLGLYQLLKNLYPESHQDIIGKFAKIVSDYDTGHWGNWRIKNMYPDDMIRTIDENVSRSVIFQQYYKYCSQLCSVKKNSADLLRFQFMFVYSLWLNTFDHIWMDGAKEKVYNSILNMSLCYESWYEERITKIHRNSADEPFEIMEGIQFLMPDTETWNTVLDIDLFVITEDNKADLLIPFSMYAKEYLENCPKASHMLMKVDMAKFMSCDMRSCDDKYNCYEIAKLNGGGGHPRAAGFPLPVD